ncbi:MAG: pirin family protein [Bryobacterales bacterium]|nr:pirin family protein [Bryobacteraceae bacterium]MDW8356197.1 pirin family protein [Bryobacterales bacterium]
MIHIRKAEERGHFDYGWLDTYHTFSFDRYYDPRYMGFRSLRVLNEDRVAPRAGFPPHRHRDMEILTYVLAGALEHRDSMGNGFVIRAGDVQRMSAGTGITHSESNPSDSEPVHLLQIWIRPNQRGLTPGYEQRTIPESEKRGQFRLVASSDGRQGSVRIHQDVALYAAILEREAEVRLTPGRYGWLQVARGRLLVNGTALRQGDGAAIEGEEWLRLEPREPSELLLFDLA